MTPNPVFKVTPFFDAAVSETVNDTAIVTIKCKQETVPKLSNGSSFNDLERPITQISRSRYYLTSNNSKLLQDNYNGRPIESRRPVVYRTVPFSMTLSNPRLQGHGVTIDTLDVCAAHARSVCDS